MLEQMIGDVRRRCRGRQDEIGRAAEQRLDLLAVGEHLRKLGVVAAVGVPARVRRRWTRTGVGAVRSTR